MGYVWCGPELRWLIWWHGDVNVDRASMQTHKRQLRRWIGRGYMIHAAFSVFLETCELSEAMQNMQNMQEASWLPCRTPWKLNPPQDGLTCARQCLVAWATDKCRGPWNTWGLGFGWIWVKERRMVEDSWKQRSIGPTPRIVVSDYKEKWHQKEETGFLRVLPIVLWNRETFALNGMLSQKWMGTDLFIAAVSLQPLILIASLWTPSFEPCPALPHPSVVPCSERIAGLPKKRENMNEHEAYRSAPFSFTANVRFPWSLEVFSWLASPLLWPHPFLWLPALVQVCRLQPGWFP